MEARHRRNSSGLRAWRSDLVRPALAALAVAAVWWLSGCGSGSSGPAGPDISNLAGEAEARGLPLGPQNALAPGSPAPSTVGRQPRLSADGLRKVIIGYRAAPDSKLAAELGAKGFRITHRYQNIPAIAAEVPPDQLEALLHDTSVAYVEDDILKYARVQQLDWGVDYIDAERVWGSGENARHVTKPLGSGQSVEVAIVDTGCDLDHPDVQANIIGNYNASDAGPAEDDDGHGTHVAGIVGAVDNILGMIGVAPGADLYIIRAGPGGVFPQSDINDALDHVVSRGSAVCNMSFGGDSATSEEQLCDQAYANGTLLLGAAGNPGDEPLAPAIYDSVIAVTATGESGLKLPGYPDADEMELAAPGINIKAAALSGGYGLAEGSSFAAPHVAGVAAILLGAYDRTNVQVRQILRDTARDAGPAGWDRAYGYGIVDAQAAFAAAGPQCETTISSAPASVEPGATIPVQWQVTSSSSGYAAILWRPQGGYWSDGGTQAFSGPIANQTFSASVDVGTLAGGVTVELMSRVINTETKCYSDIETVEVISSGPDCETAITSAPSTVEPGETIPVQWRVTSSTSGYTAILWRRQGSWWRDGGTFAVSGPVTDQTFSKDVNVGSISSGTTLELMSRIINASGSCYSDAQTVTVQSSGPACEVTLDPLAATVEQGDTVAASWQATSTSSGYTAILWRPQGSWWRDGGTFSFPGPISNQSYSKNVNVGTPAVGTVLELRARVINQSTTCYSDTQTVTVTVAGGVTETSITSIPSSVAQGDTVPVQWSATSNSAGYTAILWRPQGSWWRDGGTFSFSGPISGQSYSQAVDVGTPTVGTTLEFRSRIINGGGTVYSNTETVTVTDGG